MILTHFAAGPRHRTALRFASLLLVAWFCFHGGSVAIAQSPAAGASGPVRAASAASRWMSVPNVGARLTARDIGLVINTADAYSVEVGEHYISARGLSRSQVLRVELPVVANLPLADFRRLESKIDAAFGAGTQALALAWKTPYAVACNSITGALTLGFDEAQCANTCQPSKLSAYFNHATSRPFTDLKIRPSMLLAAKDPAGAIAMIDRGVRSDRSLGYHGGPPANVWFLRTSDAVRSVRAPLFPPSGFVRQVNIDVHVDRADALDDPKRVLLYETGLVAVDKLAGIDWVPGAMADHLTSFGGMLDGPYAPQMNSLDWIASGATATYGTVSEPCAHPQKFPHPQVLLLHYVQGASAIEAYWKSVAWPIQGVFVGEPLASPFAR